jgi:hypothetical protein
VLSTRALVLVVFAILALVGCVAVPAGPPPPIVLGNDDLLRRYPDGYYRTREGHYYHRDGDHWHYGKTHEEGVREEERRRQENEKGRR